MSKMIPDSYATQNTPKHEVFHRNYHRLVRASFASCLDNGQSLCHDSLLLSSGLDHLVKRSASSDTSSKTDHLINDYLKSALNITDLPTITAKDEEQHMFLRALFASQLDSLVQFHGGTESFDGVIKDVTDAEIEQFIQLVNLH